MPPGAENQSWSMWNATLSGFRHARSCLDAGAAVGPDGGGVCAYRGGRSSRSPAFSSTSPSSVWNTIEPSRQNSTLW